MDYGMGTCRGCGKRFKKSVAIHYYCERKCMRRHYRLLGRLGPRAKNRYVPEDLKCKECGSEFQSRQRNQCFCCKKCNLNYYSRRKYWKNKTENPEMFERHRVRRRKNHDAWVEKKRAEGRCVRCGHLKLAEGAICGPCHSYIKLTQLR